MPVVIAVVAIPVAIAVALVVTDVLICSVEGVVGIEDCCEEAEGERANAERHVEAGVPETTEHPASALGLCSLSLRPGWSFQPGVLLAGAPSAVQRDYFLSADARLAHGTLLSAGPCLQPLMKTGPAEQVSAQTDDGVPGSVQANVALEGGSIPLPFALPAAATRTVAVVAALPGREPSSAGRPAVTREPVIRGRHSVYFPNEERNEASQPAAARPEITLAVSGNG